MNPRALVAPLEAKWQEAIDQVLTRRFGLATSKQGDIAKLAAKVEQLSRAYNMAQAEGAQTKLPIEARLAFSFPRDVPKGAAAVRELVGQLDPGSSNALRVIDLGAGLGAMTFGLARALGRACQPNGQSPRSIESLLVDEDAEILRVAEEVANAASPLLENVTLSIKTQAAKVGAPISSPPADIVFLGQVLSEIAPREAPEARLTHHAKLVTDVLDQLVANEGALVIVEPALRDRTRHLHALRDHLLANTNTNVHVFAPCLHQKSCPALPIETEWCHEDLKSIDLPSWVVPIARGAGLRWQGLTFSYLVLRKGSRMSDSAVKESPAPTVRFRAISDLIVSKGKTELFSCDEKGERQRLRRLDRDDGKHRLPLLNVIQRGDIVTITSPIGGELPIDDRGRIARDANVAIDVGTFRK